MAFINLKKTDKTTMQFGGFNVDVVEAPRGAPSDTLFGMIGNIQKVFVSLLKGMKVTISYLLRPSTVVTQQYPENRETLQMFDRFRSRLVFKYNDQGEHNCTGCKVCEIACPNASIIIDTQKGDITKKVEIDRYTWRWDICTFCNACVMVCPHDALEMTGDFESAVYDRRLLIYNLNSYAGPPAKVLKKMEDPEHKQQSVVTRDVFSGPIPMTGTAIAGIPALAKHEERPNNVE